MCRTVGERGILNWEAWMFVEDKGRCSDGWKEVHRTLRNFCGGVLVNI